MTHEPMPRRWVARPDGTCHICGCGPDRHDVTDRACPYTIDSLTESQILAWHRAGGDLLTTLDASTLIRFQLLEHGLLWRPPTPARVAAARFKIAEDMNDAAAWERIGMPSATSTPGVPGRTREHEHDADHAAPPDQLGTELPGRDLPGAAAASPAQHSELGPDHNSSDPEVTP